MRIPASTLAGAVAGLNLFLALALIVVIAGNGADNPGFARADLALESAAGGASGPLPLKNGSFEGLDLNGDGRITIAEAAGHSDVVARFERADRNRDGKLTESEFQRLAKLPPLKAATAKGKPFRRSDATPVPGG